MKVLIVPSWYPTNENPNSGIFFKEQAFFLKEAGLDVTVAYPDIRSLRDFNFSQFRRGLEFNIEDGLKTYRYREYNFLPKIRNGSTIIYSNRLKKIFSKLVAKEEKPDIIHAHSVIWGGYAAAKISREYGIPLIITEHSTAFLRGIIQEHQISFIKKGFNVAEKIIVVGPGLKRELKKYTEEDKIRLIPNAVDMSKFQSSKEIIKPKKFRFFSLGFLTYKKGFDILIKAFKEAFLDSSDVELIIGGDGEERDSLERLVMDLGIEDKVKFLGELSREQVQKEMQSCNVFVLASRNETFGVVFIEALACGKPIIATRCGGPEMIVNDNNGILVEKENVEELKKSLLYMYNNNNLFNQKKIIEDCYSRFDKKIVIEKIINEYENLLNKKITRRK